MDATGNGLMIGVVSALFLIYFFKYRDRLEELSSGDMDLGNGVSILPDSGPVDNTLSVMGNAQLLA